jgi:signal transduction histidine kinase
VRVTALPTAWRSATERGYRLAVLAGLAAFVAAVYAVVVVGGAALTGSLPSPSPVLTVLATAIVAVGFEPARGRIERSVARLLPDAVRSPYDVLSRFTETVTSGYAGDDVPARIAKVLAEGTGAQWAQVWLVVHGRLSLAATWPPSADADTDPPRAEAPLPATSTLPVRHGGELLAVLRVREHERRPLTTVEQRLFAGLAAQAGLVLRQVRLRAELAERLEELTARAAELRASRERLVEAQDAERRRLERDIHDGAQQHLVALTVNLRLAETLATRAPERAADVLAQQSVAATEAIATLVDLSRGIYPRTLEAEGLVPALRAATATSAVPVRLSADELPRLAPDVEAALYFCTLEALQNAAKHAGATAVDVEVRSLPDGSVRVRVADDGRGFHIERSRAGVGLANMQDRIDAVGGALRLTSQPGAGTRLEVTVTGDAAPQGG